MKNLLILGILMIIFSCAQRIEKKGYILDNIDFKDIQKGVTSKNTLLKNYGKPTIISEINGNELWIYYSENVEHMLFFMPKIIDRSVVIVEFNAEERVANLKNLDLTNEDKKFFFNINKTFVENHNVNFFKAIYDNLGAIRPQ